ncbi:MAG: phosphatase PAP2 family protein [Fidelibacterota bacterium]
MKTRYIIFITLITALFGQDKGFVNTNFHLGLKGAHYTFFKPPGRAVLISGGLGAIVAHQFDAKMQKWFLENQPLPEELNSFGDTYGNLYSGIIVLAASAITSQRNQSLRQFEYAFATLGANGVTTVLMKEIFRRERPNGSNHRSFPSGHVSHSFATATIFKELYGWKMGVPAYGIATIVAMNRMQDNKHYFSDVIFGASLGTAFGMGFSQAYLNERIEMSFNWVKSEMQFSLLF